MKFKKPKFWDYKTKSLASIILFPLSVIYKFIFWILKILTSIKNQNSTIPIICVGNIYLGGTGKTPLVIEIYKILKSFGKNPAFIKKNYNYLYDEIRMLEKTGKVYTNQKRYDGILLSASNKHDVAILDDGFQDFSIKPDFSIICFNSKQMIGNGQLIPSGPLRENLNAIRRADCVVINGDKNSYLEEKILLIKRNIHIFYTNYKIKNIKKFQGKKITAFAGIGNPINFFELLKTNKLDLVKTYTFPDHHYYSNNDFKIITKETSNLLVTTEKDFSRMSKEHREKCDVVEVTLEIKNEQKFKELINSY